MDEARLRQSLARLAERADHTDEAAAPVEKRARARIMRNALAASLVAIVVVAGGVFAGTRLTGDDDLPPVDQHDDGYGLGEPARDGDLLFNVGVAQCSEEERLCFFDLQVSNEGDEEVGPLDTSWQVLRFEDGTTLSPDDKEIRAYRRFFTDRTPFNLPVPAGETLPAALFYTDVPPRRAAAGARTALRRRLGRGRDPVPRV